MTSFVLSRPACSCAHGDPDCSYRVAWAINPHMRVGAADSKRACAQHAALVRALARAGAERVTDDHEDRVVSRVAAEVVLPRLAGALARLSQKDRDVLLLVALADLSHQEVSEALGIPYGTVGSRSSATSPRCPDRRTMMAA